MLAPILPSPIIPSCMIRCSLCIDYYRTAALSRVMAAGTASLPPKIADPSVVDHLLVGSDFRRLRCGERPVPADHLRLEGECTVAYRIRASLRASLEIAIAMDEIVRRTCMVEL